MGKYVAVDLGASSGRVVVGDLESLEVVNRFKTVGMRVGDSLHWNILDIYTQIKKGLSEAARLYGDQLVSLGIDTWGVDYGLLDAGGALVGQPYMYRDSRTDQAMEEVFRLIPAEELYDRTGIQFQQFNTIYQLHAFRRDHPELAAAARTYLSLPDLLAYWLCGEAKNEFTHASTTQLLDPVTGDWARDVMDKAGIDPSIFGEIVPSGTVLGTLHPHIAEETGAPAGMTVVAVGAHDTASAVASVPVGQDEENLFLSSGTWSLLGVELDAPIIGEVSRKANLTNEGTVTGGTRLLKNIMGMWLLQECVRHWESKGIHHGWDELSDMARDHGSPGIQIDTDDKLFFYPSSLDDPMPERIAKYCRDHGSAEPDGVAGTVRVIFDSLAATYAATVDDLEKLTGKKLPTIHIVGGGCKDKLLCELTAEASGRKVSAGPKEATALGNIMMQAIAAGEIGSVREGRKIIAGSQEIDIYEAG